MKDGPVRRAVKRVARAWYALNLALHRRIQRARGVRPYALGGTCERCAACCEAPAIQVGWLTWGVPLLRRAFLGWQRAVNGFHFERVERGRVLVFQCTHFDRATRSCDSYESRPGMCRDYPRLLLWQGVMPQMLPGCGYRAIAPNADALQVRLRGLDLTPEQREKLRRGLGLE